MSRREKRRMCTYLRQKRLVICILSTILLIVYLNYNTGYKVGWSECMSKKGKDGDVTNYGFKHKPITEDVPEIRLVKKGFFKRQRLPVITLFTSLTDIDNDPYYNITLKNWASLRPFTKLIIFTNSADVSKTAPYYGWVVLPHTKLVMGLPVIKFMFMHARSQSNTPFYAYAKANLLFTDSFVQTIVTILDSNDQQLNPTLITGRGTQIKEMITEILSWQNLGKHAKKTGAIMKDNELGYFITSDSYPWEIFPEVLVSGLGFHEWLLYDANKRDYMTIDATETILAITRSITDTQNITENKSYNLDLLEKHGIYVPYRGGSTLCTSNYTIFESNCVPVVYRRKTRHSYCDFEL